MPGTVPADTIVRSAGRIVPNAIAAIVPCLDGHIHLPGSFDTAIESTAAMATAHVGPRSLGFQVGGEGKARHVGHDGTNEGYNASLILYPETCQGAAIMANPDNAKPLIAELLRSIVDTYHWPDTMPSAVMKRIPQSAATVKRFQGTYSSTDISGVVPFKIIASGTDSFTFDRGDGHRVSKVPGTISGGRVSLALSPRLG